MRFDLSGARAFLDYLEGHRSAEDLLSHPAYRAVSSHIRVFNSQELGPGDIPRGLSGQDSPFYGLEKVRETMPEIQRNLISLETRGERWTEEAGEFLAGLLPGEDPREVTVYPIIGYDVGIGLQGAVVMNLGASLFLEDLEEMRFVMVHEACHVFYSSFHGLPRLQNLRSPEDFWRLFVRMVQDEGFATYAACSFRKEEGYQGRSRSPLVEDYRVLADSRAIARAIGELRGEMEAVRQGEGSPEQHLGRIFSPRRLTYRVGGYLFGQIVARLGQEAAERAFYLDPGQFWASHAGLLC